MFLHLSIFSLSTNFTLSSFFFFFFENSLSQLRSMDLTTSLDKVQVRGGIEDEQLRLMEWEKQQQNGSGSGSGGVGMVYVKVMTDEQMELLRKQIAIYAIICEQLVEMHKAMTAQQDFAGIRLGNVYCDPLTTSTGHKISTRQRWTPTPMQLQILEHIFNQGTGTPSKQKIKDIANELTQHGPISETNVYNWFQNRRARSKRKQHGGASNNAESEVETEIESPKEKREEAENIQSNGNHALRKDELCFQNSERNSEVLSLNQQPGKEERAFPSDGCSKSSDSLGNMSFYDSLLANPKAHKIKQSNVEGKGYLVTVSNGIEHIMGKIEVPGSYYSYRQGDGYE